METDVNKMIPYRWLVYSAVFRNYMSSDQSHVFLDEQFAHMHSEDNIVKSRGTWKKMIQCKAKESFMHHSGLKFGFSL